MIKRVILAVMIPMILSATDPMGDDFSDLKSGLGDTQMKPGDFKQHIEFGYLGASGNSDTQTIHGLYGNDYQWSERTDMHFRADAYYASSQGETTDERYRAYGIVNHTLSDRWYDYLEAAYLRDPFEGYDAQYNGGLGMGYKIYDTPKKVLKIRGGYQYRWADLTDGSNDDYHYLKMGLNGDYYFNEKNSVESEINLLENLKETSDYETVFRIALKSHVVDQLSLKVSFELKYDNTPPLNDDGTEKEKTDTTTTVGIVYDF